MRTLPDPPPDLVSESTHQITGRGTVKVLRSSALPPGYKLYVGDPVRIDGADWTCVGIEMTSAPGLRDSIGVLVRRAPEASA